MERVKHWSGDEIIVPDGLIIMKATSSITENWHDMSAAILQPFVPPMRLCQLFQSAGTGPYKYNVIQKKSADLDRMLNTIIETYEDEKRRITSAASSTNASDKLKAMQQEQAKARASQARAKAVVALKAKKAKKVIKFG